MAIWDSSPAALVDQVADELDLSRDAAAKWLGVKGGWPAIAAAEQRYRAERRTA
jgi:hypothetical protein